MTQLVQKLFDQARKLTPEEREDLALLLLGTLKADNDPSIDAAWGREAHRRWKEYVESGEEGVDAFEAIEDARRELKRRRKD